MSITIKIHRLRKIEGLTEPSRKLWTAEDFDELERLIKLMEPGERKVRSVIMEDIATSLNRSKKAVRAKL
jgi:hypothetical protein